MIPHSFTTNAVQIQQYAASLPNFCFLTNKFLNSSEPPGVMHIPKGMDLPLDFHLRFNSNLIPKRLHRSMSRSGPNDLIEIENGAKCNRQVGESSINKAPRTDALEKRTGLQMDPLLYRGVANSCLKRFCKMQFRRVDLRSIGPPSQNLIPNLIFVRFPH